MNFSINATAGTADLQISSNQPLHFPDRMLRRRPGQHDADLDGRYQRGLEPDERVQQHRRLHEPGRRWPDDRAAIPTDPVQQSGLPGPGRGQRAARWASSAGSGSMSGLLIDTFVPTTTGNLALAQGARYKRSGLQFFGTTYTPTTMVDTLDTLDFTSITGETFYVPTIFIPIPETRCHHGVRRRSVELPRPAVLDIHLSGDRRAARCDGERRPLSERAQYRRRGQADPERAEAALRLRSDRGAVHDRTT